MNFKFLESKFFLYTLFFFVLIFFIYQHFIALSWDFTVYVLNGKHMFFNGSYFEWERPPIPSVLLGLFGIFGIFGEYLYIIFVTVLHFVSCNAISKRFKFNRTYFYVISISCYFLIYGVWSGTELLGLSFIQLFVAYFGKKKSAIFLGMSILTRYTNVVFLPVLLFNKNFKKILRDVVIIFLVLLPWFFYNLYHTGNMLTSFINSYALNVGFRDVSTLNTLDVSNIFAVVNYLLPFFLAGFILKLKKFKRYDFMMLLIFVLCLYSYFSFPAKLVRYLFVLILPVVYFSMFFVERLKFRNTFVFLLLILNITTLFFVGVIKEDYRDMYNKERYIEPLKYTNNCTVLSNAWPFVAYFNDVSEPYPREEIVKYKLEEGKLILLYKHIGEPSYFFNESFLNSFPIIVNNKKYVLLGNLSSCSEKGKFDATYLERLNEYRLLTGKEPLNYFDVFSERYKFLDLLR